MRFCRCDAEGCFHKRVFLVHCLLLIFAILLCTLWRGVWRAELGSRTILNGDLPDGGDLRKRLSSAALPALASLWSSLPTRRLLVSAPRSSSEGNTGYSRKSEVSGTSFAEVPEERLQVMETRNFTSGKSTHPRGDAPGRRRAPCLSCSAARLALHWEAATWPSEKSTRGASRLSGPPP